VAGITGAAGGIGWAVAERFVGAGLRVVLGDNDEVRLAQAVTRLPAERAHGVPVDVTDPSSVERLRDEALRVFGSVEVLFNNAGIGGGGAISSDAVDLERWHQVFAVDTFGVVHGIRAFLPYFQAHGRGHIFNMASRQGLVTTPGLGAYCPSKFATVALTEMLHDELARSGSPVSVSVVCPGGVRTAMLPPPTDTPETDDEIARVQRERYAHAVAPEFVADLLLEALATKPLYVLTHPETIEWMRDRVDRIAADVNASTLIRSG